MAIGTLYHGHLGMHASTQHGETNEINSRKSNYRRNNTHTQSSSTVLLPVPQQGLLVRGHTMAIRALLTCVFFCPHASYRSPLKTMKISLRTIKSCQKKSGLTFPCFDPLEFCFENRIGWKICSGFGDLSRFTYPSHSLYGGITN